MRSRLPRHGLGLPWQVAALEQVREECGVSRDGSKAKNLVLVARSHGLKANGYRKEPEGLREVPLPAIIHWNFNHFVVLCGFKKNKVVLNDPARGGWKSPWRSSTNPSPASCSALNRRRSSCLRQAQECLGICQEAAEGHCPCLCVCHAHRNPPHGVQLLTPIFSRLFMDHILSRHNPQWLIRSWRPWP